MDVIWRSKFQSWLTSSWLLPKRKSPIR